jgi:hypothetical protein
MVSLIKKQNTRERGRMKIARSAPVDFKAISTRCTQTGNNALNSSLATSDEIDDMIPSRIFSLSTDNPNKQHPSKLLIPQYILE